MTEILEFLARHGPAVLFAAVFIEQMGIPLPASPWLLAAGALATTGQPHWYSAFMAAASGAVLADIIWFNLGRRRGRRVLNFLCRISLEQDSCVHRTEDLFMRYGMRGVVAAKFIPGLSTIFPALAGSAGLPAYRFFFFDALGAMVYTGGFIMVGALFNRQLDQVLAALESLGSSALMLVAGVVALYIGYKCYRRQRLLKELRMARITVDELLRKLEAGENVVVIDLRSKTALEQEPVLIRGALHMTLDELQLRHQEIPRDRDVVLYCSCPNEASSARAALLLRRNGIVRVHPLLGGFDAWREHSYPTESRVVRAEISPTLGATTG